MKIVIIQELLNNKNFICPKNSLSFENTVNAYYEEINKIVNDFLSMNSIKDISAFENSIKAIKKNLVEDETIPKIKEIDIPDDETKTDKQLIDLNDRQQCLLNMIIHTIDISNPAKPDKVSSQWTLSIFLS